MNANDLILALSTYLNQDPSPTQVLNTCAQLLDLDLVWLFENFPHTSSFISTDPSTVSSEQIYQHIKTLKFTHTSHYFEFSNTSQGVVCKIKLHQTVAYLFFSHLSQQNFLKQNEFITILNLIRAYLLKREEQQQSQRNLAQVQDTFWQLINQVPILICSIDETLKIKFWNKECERVFGWTLEEMNQMPDALRTCYPDEKTYQKIKNVLCKKTSPQLIEWTPTNRQGQVLTTQWASIQLPDGQYINVGINLTEQRQAERILKHKLYVDDLTQCLSRATIIRKIDEHLCRVYDETLVFIPFSIFILDLDFFKKINDTWGHLAGDQALCHFSDLLKLHQKDGISIGRFGGEEFIILINSAQAKTSLLLIKHYVLPFKTIPYIFNNNSLNSITVQVLLLFKKDFVPLMRSFLVQIKHCIVQKKLDVGKRSKQEKPTNT